MLATYNIGPFAAGNAASIVASNTPAGAGNLAVVGGTFTADKPRRVGITLGAEAAPRVVKITGTNEFGLAISETLTCAASVVTVTEQNFASVTQVQVFAAFTAAMTVGTVVAGTNPIASTPWFAVDFCRIPVSIGYQITEGGGAITNGFALEATFDDPNAGYEGQGASNLPPSSMAQSNVPPFVFIEPNFNAGAKVTTKPTVVGAIQEPYFAIRASLYDTGTNTLQFQVIQAGAREA